VKEYDGWAEIILQEARQLGGTGVSIPPLPKNYDVEKQGHFSADKFRHPRARHKSRKKRERAKVPLEVPEDEEE
jgi:transcriptional regulator of NAD metabolism